MPAITACLMVSLLDISIVMRGSKRCSAKKSSIAARVPEPGSRTMKACLRSALDRRRAPTVQQRVLRRRHEDQRVRREGLGARRPSPSAAGP